MTKKYTWICNKFLNRKDLKAREKLLYAVLVSMADKNRRCVPGIKALATACGSTIGTVWLGLERLITSGLVEKEPEVPEIRKRGHPKCVLYVKDRWP